MTATHCCGVPRTEWMDDGGADETFCTECGIEVCSVCAGHFDVDVTESGRTRLYAKCHECAPRPKARQWDRRFLRPGQRPVKVYTGGDAA